MHKAARRRLVVSDLSLLFLEPLTRNPEGAAVLRDSAHHVVGRAIRNFCLYFESHDHIRANETNEVGYHLVCDTARVAANSRRIESNLP